MKCKKDKRYARKIIAVMCIITVFGMMIAGCSEKKDENGSMKAEDGRSYGGLIKAEAGDKVSTAFFDLTVEEAFKYDTYQFEDGLYQADAGKTYLVLKLSIKNTYEKDLPMSITDFTLDYDGNKSEDIITGYGKTDLNKDDFMENIFTLKTGESITKYVLFTVEDKDAYTLNYSEYYEDKFEGNAFQITLKPEKKTADSSAAAQQPDSGESSTDTEAPAQGDTQQTEAFTETTTAAEEAQTQAPTEAPAQTETPQE